MNYLEYLAIFGAAIFPLTFPFIYAFSSGYQENLKVWFVNLNKPSFNPPGYLFAPVWTFLYLSMGFASYLVYKNGDGFRGSARWPLVLYLVQLALNWAWPPIFFGHKELGWGAIEIITLLVTAILTGYWFYRIKPLAGYLFIPYILWLCFATTLNVQIWRLNRDDTLT